LRELKREIIGRIIRENSKLIKQRKEGGQNCRRKIPNSIGDNITKTRGDVSNIKKIVGSLYSFKDNKNKRI
jgi:hypothetical protein